MSMKLISLLFLLVAFRTTMSEHPHDARPVQTDSIAYGGVPSVTKDARGTLHLVYGRGDSVWYSVSSDDGRSFSAPELAGTLPKLFSFAMRGPQITVTGHTVVVLAANSGGNLYSFRKEAGGSWSKGERVNDADTTVKEGFSALGSDDNGHLFAAWLDLRQGGHNNIYGAQSTNGGRSWSKNRLLYTSPDGHVCECCKPSVAVQGKRVAVMFRNWVSGSRDLYLMESTDGGRSFGQARKLGVGTWPLKGCPMDGGGLAFDPKGQLQTVWQRNGSIYACTPGSEEREIGKGRGCTLAATDHGLVYAWVQEGKVVCLLPDGQKQVLGEGSLPVVQPVRGGEVVCVWQQKNAIKRSVFAL